MGEKKKQGPVSDDERQNYLAWSGSDAKWGRPNWKTTAEFVWTLLADQLPFQLDDLMPKVGNRKRPCGPEYEQKARTAKQSLVIALDCAITAGERGAMLTKNLLFDALARHWSRHYQRAWRRGARVSYDMRDDTTVPRTGRELLVAGVRFDTLWKIVAGVWSQSGINPLFSVNLVQGKGHALGWRVDVVADSSALLAFEGAIAGDEQYRRRDKRRLLLAENWIQRKRPVRQKICAERAYNVVRLGEESERILALLEQTLIKFDVDAFRDDYETLSQYYLETARRPCTTKALREYRKLQAFVMNYRRVYQQTDEIPVEYVHDADEPSLSGLTRGFPWIRSRFFRAPNRRYHAANFWPENVPKGFRDRWFRTVVHRPRIDGEGWSIAAMEGYGDFVEKDITLSQIQTLAVFLGLDELEALATSKNQKLKEWLAERLWAWNRDGYGTVLADGYTGADDPRLVAFAKAHLMRFYGGALSKIIRKCGRDPEKYGPGWRTTRGLLAEPMIKPGTKSVVMVQSGVREAVARAEGFIVSLPPWIDGLENFLAVCRKLAQIYDRRDKDELRGVVFHDPLDDAEVRWHHAQRGKVWVGHDKIEVHPSGKGTGPEFVELPLGTVDRTELARFIAPCLTHMMDAYFSSLVIKTLHASGVTAIVALHDAWYVPTAMSVPGDPDPDAFVDGGAALERAIEAAGEAWIRGLGDIYARLVYYLGDDPTFGPFVHEIRGRWQWRVWAERWPRFTTG